MFQSLTEETKDKEFSMIKLFRDHRISVIDWPTNVPVLNHRSSRKSKYFKTNNTAQLKSALRTNVASRTPQQFHRLNTSIPHCMFVEEMQKRSQKSKAFRVNI